MKKKLFLSTLFLLLVFSIAFAVDTTKPSDHNATWLYDHGRAAKADEQTCLACHDERSECIACHEDTPPRNHTNTFVNKTHGLQARWDKSSCQTCHRQDYCDACHETAYPLSHAKSGFGKMNGPAFHCETSCQLPVGNWKNTVHQNCIVCHKTRPVLRTGIPHQMD